MTHTLMWTEVIRNARITLDQWRDAQSKEIYPSVDVIHSMDGLETTMVHLWKPMTGVLQRNWQKLWVSRKF